MESNVATTFRPFTNPEATEERRPQAGPLPRKRGEIGYQEGNDEGDKEENQNVDVTPLPPRHPADRDPESTPTPQGNEADNVASLPDAEPPPSSPASSSADTSSLHKLPKSVRFLSRFDPRPALNRRKLGGVTLASIINLTIQLLLLAGFISLWIYVAKKFSHSNSGSATGSHDSGPPGPKASIDGSAMIFFHVCFGVVTLVILIFLERRIFFIRAQRYAHKHHGAPLPTYRTRDGASQGVGGLSMSFAPWNRPPLPTYAAALAQSGAGTGDVEDNLIAIPPPPPYGNTRGSTLLLAGHIRDSLRATVPQEPRASRPASQASRMSRPISYRSHDEEWEQQCDAERALYLADTLERLEHPDRSLTVDRAG